MVDAGRASCTLRCPLLVEVEVGDRVVAEGRWVGGAGVARTELHTSLFSEHNFPDGQHVLFPPKTVRKSEADVSRFALSVMVPQEARPHMLEAVPRCRG